jgi:uncharacterized membrane protein YccC
MNWLRPWSSFGGFVEHESLQPNLRRATRIVIAFMGPTLLASMGLLRLNVAFMAIAAFSVALVDVRGSYPLRFGLLVMMSIILAGAAGLGTLAARPLAAAIGAIGFVAVCGGAFRHLSRDYGASIAASSFLLALLGLSGDGSAALASHQMQATLAGGLWGVIVQVIAWPFRPQHPLRLSVSDTWLAIADLFSAMSPDAPGDRDVRASRVRASEATVRAALDSTYAALAAGPQSGRLRARLEGLNLAGARLVTRVVALRTALDGLPVDAGPADWEPMVQPAFRTLTNTARSVALAVVSRQPSHLATVDVRLRRLSNLINVLQTRAPTMSRDPATAAQIRELLRQTGRLLPAVHEGIAATIDRAGERGAFSLELFDLETWTLRPLAVSLNFNRRIDPALMRFTGRLAVLTMLGTAIYKLADLPHGYWLPFTMVVVLQPDYGSTRRRAGERMLGTLGGSIAASGLLWFHLPRAALMAAAAATIFTFGYWLRRNYAVAVVFITLFVVLLTEAGGPITVTLTIERLGSTLVGGVLALLAALFFWPVWERDRLPPVLARALLANRDYLRVLAVRLADGGGYDAAAVLAKRQAETANAAVFSSLERMIGDPRNRQDGLETAAALAYGNHRITRAFTILALHLTPEPAPAAAEFEPFLRVAGDILEALAQEVQTGGRDPAAVDSLLATLGRLMPAASPETGGRPQRDRWVFVQLARTATELGAMVLALPGRAAAAPGPAAADSQNPPSHR